MWICVILVWLTEWPLHFYTVEGKLNWEVEERITDYGQNLMLFCEVDYCCTEPSGWLKGSRTIYIDIRHLPDDPASKYGGFVTANGFGLVIRKLDANDVNITYACSYGFDLSDSKVLRFEDIFLESTTDWTRTAGFTTISDNNDDNKGIIILAVMSANGVVTLIVMVVLIIFVICYLKKSKYRPRATEVNTCSNELVPLQSDENRDEVLVHEGKDDENFLKRIVEGGMGVLESKKILLVTGMPGSGKSTIIRKISELYCQKHNFSLLDQSRQNRTLFKTKLNYFLSNDKLILHDENVMVLMDDFTSNGIISYLMDDFHILSMVNKTKCQKPDNVQIVLAVVDSSFECCMKELQKRNLLSEVVCINLDDDEFKMNDREKRQLLKTYIPEIENDYALYISIVENTLTMEDRIGFPELCYLFSSIPELRKKGGDFFRHPSSSLKEYLAGLAKKQSSEDKLYYVALIHIFLEGNLPCVPISRKRQQDIKDMTKIMELLYQETYDMEDIEDTIDKKNFGLLIKTSNDCQQFYILQNQLISNHIFNAFDTVIDQAGFINALNVFSLNFIIERLRPHTFPNSGMYKVVDKKLYQAVTERIINFITEDKLKGMKVSVQKLCLSPLLYVERFVELLLTNSKTLDHYTYDGLKTSDVEHLVKFHFPAVLLKSAVEQNRDTELAKIILTYISDALNLDPRLKRNVMETCRGALMFAVEEGCKTNDLGRIKIFWEFILKHDIGYNCSSLLANACEFHSKDTVRWILENIDITDDVVFKITRLHGLSYVNRHNNGDTFRWIIEQLYSYHPQNRKRFYLFKLIENECQNHDMFESDNLIKYLWQAYEHKILDSYIECFPNNEMETIRMTVLNIFMKASLKGPSIDLISWWIDEEGFQSYEKACQKEIRDKFCQKLDMPENLKLY